MVVSQQLSYVSHHSGLDPLHHYNGSMAGRECHHCKQWVEEGEEHDCWTTTEAALTRDLSGDLQDAWERLRETVASFGDQRIYASHKSVMFLAEVVLLLRASKEELPGSLRVPWPHAEGSAGATRRSRFEVQGRSRHSDQASGRGGGAHHRLASRSLRTVGRSDLKRRHNPRQLDTET